MKSFQTVPTLLRILSKTVQSAMILSGVIAATSANASLVQSWSFNESGGTVASNSVSSVNGTVVGTVSHPAGEVGKCYQFDNGYVTFGNSVGNFGTADFSISYWMKCSSTQEVAFLEKRPNCDMDYGPSWWSIRGISTFGMEMSGDHLSNYASVITTKALNDGVWHHLVWERQALNLRVYVDGALNASTISSTILNLTNTSAFKCAISSCDYVDGTYPYVGGVDELQVFNHALSSNEVKTIYDTVIANIPPDCATSLALAQAQLAGANATNAALLTQLSTANDTIASLQSQLSTSSNSIVTLQSQLSTLAQTYLSLQTQFTTADNLNGFYADYLTRIAEPISLLSSNFAVQFKTPDFKVPGETLDLQVSNVVSGVLSLEVGPKLKLFKTWAPNAKALRTPTPAKRAVSGF